MKNEQAECLKIPVVVGVSGHIDVAQDEPWILSQLAVFWKKVREIVGAETPIVLLSSLAQGADHYVVRSMPEDGKRYCAVLPFAREEYEKDFVDHARKPGALDEFLQDLAGACKVVQCDAEPGDYAAASDYVRSRSDILITLWDGYESLNEDGSPKKGGTYHLLRTAFGMDDLLIRHQEKAHLIVNLTVSRESGHKENEGCVCRFPEDSALNVIGWDEETRRFSTRPLDGWVTDFLHDGPSKGLAGGIKKHILGTASEDSLLESEIADVSPVFRRIRKYNGQAFRIPGEKNERNYLFANNGDSSLAAFPDDWGIVQDDFARYECFDKQATTHQCAHKSQFARIALLSVIVGLLGQAWGDVTFAADDAMHEWIMHGVILMYLLGCLCLFIWGARISRQDHYGHYVQPRVISELMRLKMFWKLAGITDSFTDYILKDSADYWFALPICNWDIWDAPLGQDEIRYVGAGKGLPAVCSCWLEDQKNYYDSYLLSDPDHFIRTQDGDGCRNKPFFSGKWRRQYFKKYERLDGYFSLLKTVFTWSGFILACLLILVFSSAQIWEFDHTEFLHLSYYREFIVGICPFVVATLGWLLEKNNWDSLARQYREMSGLFGKAIAIVRGELAKEKKDVALCRRTIKELMLFCHRENADWKNIKNDSKPEPMM